MSDRDAQGDPPTASTTPGGRGGARFAIGALIVAGLGFLVVALGGIGKNLVYYWGPTEMKEAGAKAIGATIRLGGLVAEGSVRQGGGVSGIEFDVVDRKGGLTHVKCSGVPPQMFRERIGVVVEGTMTAEGYFQGNRLMVSHGNEYRAPTDKENRAIEELMKSARERGRSGGPGTATESDPGTPSAPSTPSRSGPAAPPGASATPKRSSP